MSIADNLIANETIDATSTKAWIAPVRDSVLPVGLFVVAFLVDWLAPNSTTGVLGWVGSLLNLIRVGLIVVAIGWIAYNLILWRTAEFAVTNLRVIREEGFISRRSSATLLTSISDVKSRVGLLGKSLHYGDLEIYTQSGAAGVDRFRTITLPDAFRNAIMSRKMGDRPGASGVAPAAVAAPAVAPVAAPAPAAGPSSAELAALLSSLADLRDKGAITAEEFEAKKAEVLARM
ncbi:MAG: PH domain-containing protein [Candidatus Limnocylindrales bacterium]